MMNRVQILDSYAKSMSGVLSQTDVGAEVKRDETHCHFPCPCGGRDHYATRALVRSGIHVEVSEVLHCWDTDQQWTVKSDVSGVIRAEEEKFAKLLDRFESEGLVGKRVSAAEAFRLRTERGVPEDMLDIDDVEEFDRLWREHQEVSRASAGRFKS